MGRHGRRHLQAWISDEAYAGWQSFAREFDVSITSTLEAIGLALHAGHPAVPPEWRAVLMGDARRINDERKRRRR